MRILHAIHDFLPRHRAGSEIYAFELSRAQRTRGLHSHVLAAEYDPARAHGFLEWREFGGIPVTEVINNSAWSTFAETYRSPAFADKLGEVLDAVGPDVLHIHNLLNLSFELPALARSRGIPSVATLHDYTLVCPSGGQRVHVAEQHVCFEIDPGRCARCFDESPWRAQMAWSRMGGGRSGRLTQLARAAAAAVPGLLPMARAAARHAPLARTSRRDIEDRLAAARTLFTVIDRFVAPSRTLGEEFIRLGLPADRLEVMDYGFPPLNGSGTARPATRAARTPDAPLRVGFIGTIIWHKGVHILIEAAARSRRADLIFEVHGDLATAPEYSAALRANASDLPVRFPGAFAGGHAGQVLADLDVLVVPSLWPENSPLVIHEAFQAGIPVVASRIGGIPDLVVHEHSGLLFEAGSSAALAAALARLASEPGLRERLRAAAPAVRSIDDDARRFQEIYHELLR